MTLSSWLENTVKRADVCALLEAFFRLSSYGNNALIRAEAPEKKPD